MKVAISGLTAAGKTTLARRLAGQHGVGYHSGSQVMRDRLGETAMHWTPELDARRTDLSLERDIDTTVLSLFEASESGVFDAWSLPWLATKDDVFLWIESDLESRVRKCMVSYAERGCHREYDECLAIVTAKDLKSQTIFRSNWGFDIMSDRSPFHVLLDASALIPEATVEAARRGAEALYSEAVSRLAVLGELAAG